MFKTLSWPKLLELLDVQLEGSGRASSRLFAARIEEEAREMTLIAGVKLLLSAQDGQGGGDSSRAYVKRLRAASGSPGGNGDGSRNHLVAAVADVFQASCRMAEPFYTFGTELWRQVRVRLAKVYGWRQQTNYFNSLEASPAQTRRFFPPWSSCCYAAWPWT